MATQKTVPVTYDPTNHKLHADPFTLENDEWVLWTFSETSAQPPADSRLFIHFEQQLGPFQAVRNVSPRHLVAKGNTGTNGIFFYFLALVSPSLDLTPSGPFTVQNNGCVNISPHAKVTYIPPATAGGMPQFQVEPSPLLLHNGDVVLWEINNLPADHFLAFDIPKIDTGVISSPDTPFPDVFMFNSNDPTQRLGGAVFRDTRIGTIHYNLKLWGPQGGTPIGPDPTIDGLGRPPGT